VYLRLLHGVLLAVALISGPGLTSAGAQATDSTRAEPQSRGKEPADRQGFWRRAIGVAEDSRFFAGLWVFHVERPDDGLRQHHLLALSWRGVYLATFMSSQGGRIWGLGASRTVLESDKGDTELSLGYRIGVVRGYDRRFLELAERWPVLPAAEIVAGLRYRRGGVLFSYAGVVASVGGFIPLGR
jgi:hypothetical protein